MTTEQFRAAARKNGKGWLCTTMRHTSIVAILFSVIFGTHYDQDAVNANKDANGLFQGGLGAGLTQMPNLGSLQWLATCRTYECRHRAG